MLETYCKCACAFLQRKNIFDKFDFKQCTNLADIVKMYMYLSEAKNYNFDKIPALLYLVSLVRYRKVG